MTYSHGFIALTAVLVLSAIFLSVTITIASRAITESQSTIAYLERDQAQFRTEACIEHALVELMRTFEYDGNETISIDDGECAIGSISGSGWEGRTIEAWSTVGAHTYRVVVRTEEHDASIVVSSYERVVAF
jgi:hypothetical protein